MWPVPPITTGILREEFNPYPIALNLVLSSWQ